MKEFLRKKIVYLKRHPQIIPFIFLIAACVTYTFNMTIFSKSMAYVAENDRIAFNMFVITLSAFMSVLLYFSVIKRLNKGSIIMLITCSILAGLQVILDIYYIQTINYWLYLSPKPIPSTEYLTQSISTSIAHLVILGLYFVSVGLLPVYSRLLKRIDTTTPEEKALRMSSALVGNDKIEITDY